MNFDRYFNNIKIVSALRKRNGDRNKVYFPLEDSKLETEIGTPLSLLMATILRAGYHSVSEIEQTENDDVLIKFNGKIVQVLRPKFINTTFEIDNEKEKLNEDYKNNPDIDNKCKFVFVGFNQEKFLQNDNSYQSHLSYWNTMNKEMFKKRTVEIHRNLLYYLSGMNIEEFEINNHEVDLKASFDDEGCEQIFINSVPTELQIRNVSEIQNKLNFFNATGVPDGKIDLRVAIESASDLPIYNANPIRNIANYRNLEIERFISEGEDFLKTMIEQFVTNENFLEELKDIENSNSVQAKRYNAYIKENYILKGNEKKLWSLDANNVESHFFSDIEKEKLMFIGKNLSIINGQHSTTFFAIIHSLLSENHVFKQKLFMQYNRREDDFKKLLGFSIGNGKSLTQQFNEMAFGIFKNYYSDLSKEEQKNKFEKFKSELNNFVLPICFTTKRSLEVALKDIEIENNNLSQNVKDIWLNESKEVIELLLTEYNEYNRIKIKEAKKLNPNLSYEITSIKSINSNPQIETQINEKLDINDIFPFINALFNPTKIQKDFINNIESPHSFWIEALNWFNAPTSRVDLLSIEEWFLQGKKTRDTVISTKIKEEDFEFKAFKATVMNYFQQFEDKIVVEKKQKRTIKTEIGKERFYDAILGAVALYHKAKIKFEQNKKDFKLLSKSGDNGYEPDRYFVGSPETFVKIIFYSLIRQNLNASKDIENNISYNWVQECGDLFIDRVILNIKDYIFKGGSSLDEIKKAKNKEWDAGDVFNLKMLGIYLFENKSFKLGFNTKENKNLSEVLPLDVAPVEKQIIKDKSSFANILKDIELEAKKIKEDNEKISSKIKTQRK